MWWIALAGVLISSDWERESQIQTPSGMLERWTNPENIREYGVRRIPASGDQEWIEKVEPTGDGVRWMRGDAFQDPAVGLLSADENFLEIMEVRPGEAPHLISREPRSFEKSVCSAAASVKAPTAMESRAHKVWMQELLCNENAKPLPAMESFRVFGKEVRTELECGFYLPHFCFWKNNSPEAFAQISVTYFLNAISLDLFSIPLRLRSQSIRVFSQAYDTNRSNYEPDSRRLFLGKGQFDDSLDGFVVLHEWTHSYIEDLNPILFGYEARVIHEAFSDFMAAQFLGSACIAPYDAQEESGRKCLRNLDNKKVFPEDMNGGDDHADSQVLSGALWSLRGKIPRALLLEAATEALMRLPKAPQVPDFWQKLEKSMARITLERSLAPKYLEEIHQAGSARGFITAALP